MDKAQQEQLRKVVAAVAEWRSDKGMGDWQVRKSDLMERTEHLGGVFAGSPGEENGVPDAYYPLAVNWKCLKKLPVAEQQQTITAMIAAVYEVWPEVRPRR